MARPSALPSGVAGTAGAFEPHPFCMVRFGNVLASSGSVATVVQEQLRRGGPSDRDSSGCHPLFMTIPEARAAGHPGRLHGEGGDCSCWTWDGLCALTIWPAALVNLMGLTVRTADNPEVT